MKFLQCNECDILLSGYYFILMGKFFCEKDYKVCKILEIFDRLFLLKNIFLSRS